MKPSLARYALAVALLGTISGGAIGFSLMRQGTPDNVLQRALWWVLAVIAGMQIGPAIGFLWSRGALQQGLLPLWSRGTKRAFTVWAILATPTALFGLATAIALFIFR